VKIGETPLGAASAPVAAVGPFLAAALLATALRFFLAVFLAADFVFRVRMAFFCIELRLEGMGILSSYLYSPLGGIAAIRRSYNSKLKPVQVIRFETGSSRVT